MLIKLAFEVQTAYIHKQKLRERIKKLPIFCARALSCLEAELAHFLIDTLPIYTSNYGGPCVLPDAIIQLVDASRDARVQPRMKNERLNVNGK